MLKPPNVGSDEKKIKISLQWKGARSPVIMTHGVWTFGGSLLKMIQFLRDRDSIRDD